jgi:MoaA/NifB/PqqE/SkfB family radical SAM enzyme
METGLQKWQRSMIRKNLEDYRQRMAENYIGDKRIVEVGEGLKAYSLLTPPLGSPVARRRIRFIARDIADYNTVLGEGGRATYFRRTPHFLTIAVTYRCQCDCDHCSASEYREDVANQQTDLTLLELKDAISQAVQLGTTCVVLTGGEPLLLDGLCDLVASVDKTQACCILFTNGELLTSKTIRNLKEAGLLGVFVSLDASDPEVHDLNRRRPGIFQRACEGIRLAQEAGLLTGISSYITRAKLRHGELDAMMELGLRLGVLEVFWFDIIATGKLSQEWESMLTDEEWEQVQDFRKHYQSLPDYPRIIHQTMFTSIAYPCAAEGCPAGAVQMHIRGNGDVAPCDFSPFAFGNLRQRRLADIWEHLIGFEFYRTNSPRCRLADRAYWKALADYCSTTSQP